MFSGERRGSSSNFSLPRLLPFLITFLGLFYITPLSAWELGVRASEDMEVSSWWYLFLTTFRIMAQLFSLSFKGHNLTFGKHMILQLYKIPTGGVKGMYLEHGDGVVSLYLLLGAIDSNLHLSFLLLAY